MSWDYFRQGYGIAAGYGFNFYYKNPSSDHINNLYDRVTRYNVRVTPEMAGPLPREGAYPVAVHTPGMPLLVAAVNRVFGIRADEPIQFLGGILDAISAAIVCWMVGTFFHRRVGFVTGILYALFFPLAYQSACAKMPDGFIAFFVVCCLACIFQATRCGKREVFWWFSLAGLILGLGSYFRPNYTLMPMFLILGLWAYTHRFFHSVAAMLLTQFMVFLALFPWAYRNYSVFGRWIFTSTGSGGALIVGLGQFSNPWGFEVSDQQLHELAQGQGYAHAWGPEADIYCRELFFQSVKQHPGAWLRTIARRAPMALATPYYWGYDNPSRKKTFLLSHDQGKDRYGVFLNKPLSILAKFWDRFIMSGLSLWCFICVVLMWAKERHRWGLILLLLSPHIYVLITHILIYFASKHVVGSMFCWLIGLAYILVRGGSDKVKN